MITAIALVFVENAFFSWLFEIAPKAAVAGAVMWVLLRWAVKYGKFEASMEAKFKWIEGEFKRIDARIDGLEVRIDRLEVRITAVEVRLGELEKTVASIDTRLGRVEGQLEIVIDLLRNKK